MNAIEVHGVSKDFRAKVKPPGLWNSLKSLVSPQYKNVKAVKNINIQIKQGELVGFIGPNGAGKSTAIKMMTGILHPSRGKISVLGFNPQEERQQLAFHIGAIFGQRQQLLYHLPAMDTFELYSKIYELEESDFKKHVQELIKIFKIDELVHIPVKKLSLGQRMRCEFVASILHKPEVLFLDEPTIGLDIIAKRRVRELIRKLNKEQNLTVILTSHDLDDIEELCPRVIVINQGKVLYDGSMERMRKRITTKIMEFHLAEQTNKLPTIPGVKILIHTPALVKLEVNKKRAPVRKVLSAYMTACKVADVVIEEPPIEEIIEKLYQ
ncbi:MAG: ATP-binding cassette domain-containing protein [Candidatus Woesearchaeota archaeon]|jgi:ABC-2 type transport system ATP-binding protein|nr:ATP-binding cassette domain-containing protein [Candidatus Woesearchaeota archaeon]MDP7199084.1 ATP-binding cassette domain-containing protein [Candidatus Woesearchaeota archaeon]MDP7467794.1 ATP-binding cassette domain-containing protein [Candidatus Woesearchaeota archaeon]MDP7646497.1 ATP-binding cassette domain-containing protein [Candidatus Woesearchaeota archaeon]